MATQQKPAPKTSTFVDDVEDSDDLPPEFTGDAAPTGLSSDDIIDMPFDNEQIASDAVKMDPPAGDWYKTDRWTVQERCYPDDSMPGDKNPGGRIGRTYYIVNGIPDSRTVNDFEYSPMLFIRMSFDRRMDQKDNNKFDLPYRIAKEAWETYIAVHGEQPKTTRQFTTFLSDDDYMVRTMKGGMVVGMRAKKG